MIHITIEPLPRDNLRLKLKYKFATPVSQFVILNNIKRSINNILDNSCPPKHQTVYV